MLGKTISHYRITEKLGQGGMGEVYLAEDTRLGRKVALKFLAPELARDRKSLVRFRNEARAAAELSHPNIATIHDIGETDGKPFLVLEYLEGQTLGERTAQGPLPVEDVLRIGKELASGLAEAHAAGIVHRDIKSANVMLTTKGGVKILDFGLARRDDNTQITRPGTTLGTIAYMSPEQAQGQIVDWRSDIWSLGIVLYECLTGTLPFTGDAAVVLEQIKTSPVTPPTAVRTGIPMELEYAVLRCLEKSPELRYQHADELLASLRSLETRQFSSDHGTLQDSHGTPGRTDSRSRTITGFALALTAFVVILLIWQRPWDRGQPDDGSFNLGSLVSPPRVTPFLADQAIEIAPAWSPKGNLVAYAAQTDGDWDIWLCDLDGSNPLNLTKDPDNLDSYPEWSPDGQTIAFYSTRDGPGIYTMTVTGGNIRRLLPVKAELADNGLFSMQWLDKDLLIYGNMDASTRPDVYEYRLSSGESSCLTTLSPAGAYFGRVNEQGTHLSYVRPVLGMDVEIYVQDLQTGEIHTMPLAGRLSCWGVDGQTLLIMSSMDGSRDLWSLEVDLVSGEARREARRLTTALSIDGLSLSPDGRRAIATQSQIRSNVWSLPTHIDPLSDIRQGEQLTDDAFDHTWACWLPGEKSFLDGSNRRGVPNVWKVNTESGDRSRLSEERLLFATPSPGGRWIVCWRPEDDGTGFPYLMRPDGSGFRELDPLLREKFVIVVVADWSSDGEHLVFHTLIEDVWRIGIMTIDEETGTVSDVRLLLVPGSIPFWSPDGKFLVFGRTENGQSDLFITNIRGDDVFHLTNSSTTEWVCGWESEPSRIYFKDGADNTVYRVPMDAQGRPESDPEVWIHGSTDMVVRQWLDFSNGRAIGPIAEFESDLWMVEFEQ